MRRDFGGKGVAVVALNTDRDEPRKNLVLTLRAPAGLHAQEWDLDEGTRRNAAALTEADCRRIIESAPAPGASPRPRRFKKR